MIWNVYLYSQHSGEILTPVIGYDGRPLRFTEKRYADRYVHEMNNKVQEVIQSLDVYYVVCEESEGEQ
jgi:hypothetical protein